MYILLSSIIVSACIHDEANAINGEVVKKSSKLVFAEVRVLRPLIYKDSSS